MINILINGSCGKMGNILKECIKKIPNLYLKYEIDKNTPLSFKKLSEINDKPDVIIDFSVPSASFIALDYAVCHLVPIVIATTGFNKKDEENILEYSEAIPIFKSPNMSLSIYLISKVLKYLAPFLSNMDIEIIDKHHNQKKDSPSGTALFLANSINSSTENKYNYVFNRHEHSSFRDKNEIGFSSIRGGNIIGEHSVLFIGENEIIELKHSAFSREIFANGAIMAAKFIINQKNGLYGMEDLISI